ncbi:alpha-1,2-fucosyltransferase [Spirosoma knui]
MAMVVAKITSGLGNQLFQYALARSLSLRNQASLYFDLSYYNQTYASDTARLFRLQHFNINYRVLNASPYRFVAKATKLLPGRTLKPLIELVQERQFQFNPSVLRANARLLTLDGFWQSESYFETYADLIRAELSFTHQHGLAFTTYQRAIETSTTPVSVHIRRGDYVAHPEFSKTFGFVGLDYYQAAIELLKKQFPNLHLFVFSDDQAWVQANLGLDVPHTFVSNIGENADLDDLQLMSLCQHHVIANSSYSWWGAWLNPLKTKRVIAPKQWFRNKPDCNTDDLIPPSWLRL